MLYGQLKFSSFHLTFERANRDGLLKELNNELAT